MNKNDFKEEIIETGRKLFAQYGFKKTSMNDVARKLNKVKGSLYYYFKSKDDLITAILEKEAAIIRNMVMDAINKETDPIKKMRAYAITRLTRVVNIRYFYKVMINESFENSELFQNFEKKYEEEHIIIIKDILRYGEKQKVYFLKNIDVIAYAIFTQITHLERPCNLEMELETQKSIVDDLLHILFYGIVNK